jgi:hypothetical protein
MLDDISFRVRVRRSLSELLYLIICDTMFDLVVVVGIRKHERKCGTLDDDLLLPLSIYPSNPYERSKEY